MPAPNFLGALEVLLDTVRSAGYGRQAAVRIVDLAIDSLAAMAAEFPGAAPQDPKPRSPSEGQLAMRRQLRDLAGADYPRIREAAIPLTTPEPADAYAKLGIDILVAGIESAAPKRRRR